MASEHSCCKVIGDCHFKAESNLIFRCSVGGKSYGFKYMSHQREIHYPVNISLQ
ncbi:hypothetical protein Nmel_012173 [Mimus melanotis]